MKTPSKLDRIKDLEEKLANMTKAFEDAIERNVELRERLTDLGGNSPWLHKARQELWNAITIIDGVTAKSERSRKRREKTAV